LANAGSLESLFAGIRAAEGDMDAALRPEDIEQEAEQPLAPVNRAPILAEARVGMNEGEQLRLLLYA
jgi:hypothetical protein